MGILQGKTAIITGGGRGIGAACALRFAEEGARVMLASRTEVELKETAAFISARVPGVEIAYYATDVSDEESVTALFAASLKAFGPVSLLVCAAAIIGAWKVEDTDIKQFDRIMAVNVGGTMLCCREAFRQMQASGQGGAITTISSLGGIRSTQKFPGYSAYCASKSALIGLTECMAAEGKPHQIRVNCLAPGAVDTRMLKQADPSLKTSTSPADIAGTLLFLSDETQSAKLTGAVIEIHSND